MFLFLFYFWGAWAPLLGDQAKANTSDSVFQSLNSPHLRVASRETTQSLRSKTYVLNKLGLTWRPELQVSSSAENCSPSQFRRALHQSSKPELIIKKFWRQCESTWRLNSFNGITHSANILRTAFEPTQHPGVRKIEWALENGVKVPGLLFLKGPITRPLVILRTGIFSSLTTAVAERFAMMQLFDEGPYHLLVLPSTSGKDYIESNSRFVFGGFDEGLQTARIIDLISDPREPIHAWVSKIHLVGISLGSHGLWLLNWLQPSPGKPNLIDRTLQLCPTVDLRATAAEQRRNLLSEFFVKSWFERRLYPNKDNLGLKDNETVATFIQRSIDGYQQPTLPWPLTSVPLPVHPHPFWVYNDFWSWLPTYYNFDRTLVAWTRLDPVVPPAQNAATLPRRQQAPEASLLEFPRGFHCSLPTTYQWSIISLMLRGYLDSTKLGDDSLAFEQTFENDNQIKSIEIRHLNVEEVSNRAGDLASQGEEPEKSHPLFFKTELFVTFQNPFKPPQTVSLMIPTQISQHHWLLEDFNEALQETVVRELSSRMVWVQNASHWQVGFRTVPGQSR